MSALPQVADSKGRPVQSLVPRRDDIERVRAITDRQLKRLGSLVNTLLDVSRIQAGRLELNPARVDLRELVAEVVTQLGDELARSGNTLTVRAADHQEGPSDALEVLLLGGLPINEPIAHYGPFVMNTREEILEAVDDFNAGRMGTIPVLPQ